MNTHISQQISDSSEEGEWVNTISKFHQKQKAEHPLYAESHHT
jgi:hypothetical protein